MLPSGSNRNEYIKVDEQMQSSGRAREKAILACLGPILSLPDVSCRRMFGSPCLFTGARLFGFVLEGGIVLTKLGPSGRKECFDLFGGSTFISGTRVMRSWVLVPLVQGGAGTGPGATVESILHLVEASRTAAASAVAPSPGSRSSPAMDKEI